MLPIDPSLAAAPAAAAAEAEQKEAGQRIGLLGNYQTFGGIESIACEYLDFPDTKTIAAYDEQLKHMAARIQATEAFKQLNQFFDLLIKDLEARQKENPACEKAIQALNDILAKAKADLSGDKLTFEQVEKRLRVARDDIVEYFVKNFKKEEIAQLKMPNLYKKCGVLQVPPENASPTCLYNLFDRFQQRILSKKRCLEIINAPIPENPRERHFAVRNIASDIRGVVYACVPEHSDLFTSLIPMYETLIGSNCCHELGKELIYKYCAYGDLADFEVALNFVSSLKDSRWLALHLLIATLRNDNIYEKHTLEFIDEKIDLLFKLMTESGYQSGPMLPLIELAILHGRLQKARAMTLIQLESVMKKLQEYLNASVKDPEFHHDVSYIISMLIQVGLVRQAQKIVESLPEEIRNKLPDYNEEMATYYLSTGEIPLMLEHVQKFAYKEDQKSFLYDAITTLFKRGDGKGADEAHKFLKSLP